MRLVKIKGYIIDVSAKLNNGLDGISTNYIISGDNLLFTDSAHILGRGYSINLTVEKKNG